MVFLKIIIINKYLNNILYPYFKIIILSQDLGHNQNTKQNHILVLYSLTGKSFLFEE